MFKIEFKPYRKMPSRFELAMMRTLGFVFLAISIIAFVAGGAFLVRNAIFMITSAKTAGTIVGIVEERQPGRAKPLYAPTFTFTDQVGIVHTNRTALGASWMRFSVGDVVPVRFKPANLEHAKIATFFELFFPAILVMFMGFCGASFCLLWNYLLGRIASGK